MGVTWLNQEPQYFSRGQPEVDEVDDVDVTAGGAKWKSPGIHHLQVGPPSCKFVYNLIQLLIYLPSNFRR